MLEDPRLPSLPPELTSIQVGIWRVLFERNPTSSTSSTTPDKRHKWSWTDLLIQPLALLPILYQQARKMLEDTHLPRLIMDVHALGPGLFWIMVMSYALTGVEDALLLWLNNRVFALIEAGLNKSSQDGAAIARAVVYRIGSVALIVTWRWFSSRCEPILKARVKLFFQSRLMAAHLAQDLPTAREASSSIDASPLNAWYALQNLFGTLDVLFSTVSQAALLINLTLGNGLVASNHFALAEVAGAGMNGTITTDAVTNPKASGVGNSIIVLAICLAWPIVNQMLTSDLDHKMYVAYISNPHYIRTKTLYDLAAGVQYKREVIGGTLGEYIRHEHTKSRQQLGIISDDYPSDAYALRKTPLPAVILGVLDDLPLIYYAISSVVFRDGGLSIASLTMLHQTLGITRSTISRIIMEKRNFVENLRSVKAMYDGVGQAQKEQPVEPTPSGEDRVDPAETKGIDLTSGQGIGIELKDVTFNYPSVSSEDTSPSHPALSNVSFVLPPSSLVVIVGANGSGKSSLVNLFSCIYKPTKGHILFNGIDPHARGRQSGKEIEQLQRSMAVLTQDHSIFQSFPVWENIAVGDPDVCLDPSALSETLGERKVRVLPRVREAARLGGALEFVEKLERGFDEVLRPVCMSFGTTYPMPDGPLKDAMDRLEWWKDVSGGEEQRLAASRTFMRLMNPRTRLVVVDEPSSAMDPLGEFELFERLREKRMGKTMVFVTHRFGHLTKYADVILCMKSGQLVEVGTHQELMAKQGEYCNLYDIQARAFTDILVAEGDGDGSDGTATDDRSEVTNEHVSGSG